MGSLHHFNIAHLARQHGCRRFIETGTAHGHGLAHAAALGCFDRLDSIEAHAPTYEAVQARFAGQPGIHVHHGHSPEVLPRLLTPSLQDSTTPIGHVFFWLDAHFPGADTGPAVYDAEPDPVRRWPLQAELDAITAAPDVAARSVLLLDDLRIYTGQAWRHDHCRRAPNPAAWLFEPVTGRQDFPGADPALRPPALDLRAFHATHTLEIWHWHEGYVLLSPNDLALAQRGLGRSVAEGKEGSSHE